jgi:hypothetical protein
MQGTGLRGTSPQRPFSERVVHAMRSVPIRERAPHRGYPPTVHSPQSPARRNNREAGITRYRPADKPSRRPAPKLKPLAARSRSAQGPPRTSSLEATSHGGPQWRIRHRAPGSRALGCRAASIVRRDDHRRSSHPTHPKRRGIRVKRREHSLQAVPARSRSPGEHRRTTAPRAVPAFLD